jgi:transcriptional regulator with XRE-family HTH domain
MIGMSPTYLSKIEREELPPPAPDKLVAIAKQLGFGQDELFALACRLPTDIPEIIHRRPAVADLLRRVRNLTNDEVRQLTLGLPEPKARRGDGRAASSRGKPPRDEKS